jgi:hypothetical protein
MEGKARAEQQERGQPIPIPKSLNEVADKITGKEYPGNN